MSIEERFSKIQELLADGATIVPIILASDSTQLKVFGDRKAYPVYMTIGNISKAIRRRPSQRAWILVGYIPVPDLACIKSEEKKRQMRWNIFHKCMAKLMEPLDAVAREGIEMVCADGGIR